MSEAADSNSTHCGREACTTDQQPEELPSPSFPRGMSEEAELPPDYEEVVNSQTTQMDCTASTLIQRVHYHVGKSEGEVNLPGLTSTDPPPSYPFEGHTTATSPSSDPHVNTDSLQLQETCLFCCYTGLGGLRMPRTMVAAWKIGMKRIMSIGGIGNWPRYIFLAVQSLLLLVGVIVACFVFPFESRVVEILHVTALSTALVVNISERLLFLCLRRVSRDNCVAWNFCADITRVLATEFFIFVALMAALYDAFSFYEGANSVESAVVILLTGFVGFLTSVVMKTYMAIKFTYSLHIMARRVTNRSNAATSRKCLLFWICIITCLESALQVLLVIVIILLMSDNELAFYGLVLMFSGSFLPVFSWGLCLWNSSPWLRFLPLSVAIDFPPAPDYPEEINVSHHFHQMYRYSKTCSGVMVNFLRLLTSPFFAILHVLFLVTCVVTFFYISVVWYVSLYDYLLLVPLFSLGVIILQVFLGLPSLIFGLVIVLLIPISPCLYPLLCFVFNVYIHKPWTS